MILHVAVNGRPPTRVAGSMPSSRSLEDPASDALEGSFAGGLKGPSKLKAGRKPSTSSPKWENLGREEPEGLPETGKGRRRWVSRARGIGPEGPSVKEPGTRRAIVFLPHVTKYRFPEGN